MTSKNKRKPKAMFSANGGHPLIRAAGVTVPIQNHLNKLLAGEAVSVDAENYQIYLHSTNPKVWQHVGAGLISIVNYMEVYGIRYKTQVSVSKMLELIGLLLHKQELGEELIEQVIVELKKAQRVMGLLSINDNTSIVQTVRLRNAQVAIDKTAGFPLTVVL